METNYSSKTLDHLGLISGICKELHLVEAVDSLLPRESLDKIVSNGESVLAMILNGLGFVNQPLYLTPKFFEDKPLDKLISPYLKAEHLNDDCLGRCLDKIYDYGCVAFYNQVVSQALQYIDVDTSLASMDMTNLTLHGEYKTQLDKEVQITNGSAKDHRYDLNLISLMLICLHQSKIPILMQPLSGNASETDCYQEIIKNHIADLQTNIGMELISFDSKGYTEENIQILSKNPNLTWVSRPPNSIGSVKELYSQIELDQMESLDENYHILELCNNYGGVNQRWALIYSKKLAASKVKKIEKQINKALKGAQKESAKLMRQSFSCKADAQLALDKLQQKWKYVQLESHSISEKKKYLKPGKPTEKTPYKMEYKINAKIQVNQTYKAKCLKESGFFVIATNQLDPQKLAIRDFLKKYKGQDAVEKGFRFIKDDKVVSTSLNLKKDTRIQALLTVMTLCLFVYACLEHKIRTVLQNDPNEGFFKDQKGKITKKPTARWVFYCFKGIHRLIVNKQEQLVININEIHRKLLDLLGKNYWIYYS